MSQMLDIAVGRACHFCGAGDALNTRVRRQAAAGSIERLTVPLCHRHRLLLRSAPSEGRLHRPTGVRWWYGEPDSPDVPLPDERVSCPAGVLLQPDSQTAPPGGRDGQQS